MGQSVHFIKDLGSGHEGGGVNLRSAPGGRYSSYATADEYELINGYYYCWPGKGALSSNTC